MSYKPAVGPASERTAAIANGTRAWLSSLLEKSDDRTEASVNNLCHILVASWICDAVLSESASATFPEIARHVARLLNASEGPDCLGDLKPTLRLIVEILFSSQGLDAGPFRQFFNQSVSLLKRLDPARDPDLALADKRTLLHHAGILPPPKSPFADSLPMSPDRFRLSASSGEVEALTFQLEYLTGWGTQPVNAGLIEPWLGEFVGGLVVHRLRNYDLISAARLLRLHGYLAASGITSRREDLYDAFCIHCQPRGPFGWYGPESAALRQASPCMREEMEFYLVTTLECLWTLAERSGRWRLFAAIPHWVAPGHLAGAQRREQEVLVSARH